MATAVADQGATFSIANTKLYVAVVTSSTQNNTILLEQLKSGFKRTLTGFNINKKIKRKTKSIIRLLT